MEKYYVGGQNKSGQLAIGNTQSIGDQVFEMGDLIQDAQLGLSQRAETIECGGMSCCAFMLQKTMKCWGHNINGKLGLGNDRNWCNSALTIGDQLPFVDMGPFIQVQDVVVSKHHICAELQEEWRCWGMKRLGALGAGHSENLGGDRYSVPSQLPPIEL